MDLDMQIELFDQAMDELATDGDLVNQVLEVTMEDDTLHVRRYRLRRLIKFVPGNHPNHDDPTHVRELARPPPRRDKRGNACHGISGRTVPGDCEN